MKALVIYHANCVDGAAAAWVMGQWFEATAEAGGEMSFLAGEYQKAPPDVTGRDVFLVDFSYKAGVVQELLRTANSVTILDHHKSALLDLQPMFEEGLQGMIDLSHSGCMVAWRWAFGDAEPPRLLKHIEDRDLWRFALPNTRELHAWITSFPLEYLGGLIGEFEIEGDTAALIQGRAIERKHQRDIANLLPTIARPMVIGGHTVAVANLPPTMASDAGHALAAYGPFAAIYYDGDGVRHFSLRSREDGLDVSEIATQYGGGGHKHAAGFSVPFAHELGRA